MRWIQESRHNVQALTLELQGCRDRSATRARQDTAQQTELPAAQSESEPQEHGDASPPGVSRKELCLKPPAWLRDDQPPPWSAARHCSRFMVQPREWSEEFDGAYIGLVEEFGDEIASGFGGAVKQARWADFVVASKRFHRGDAELFAELYFGLLIGASPVIGFGVTAEGHPRLVSAWLQETSLQHVRRMASTEAGCLEASKRFMCDLLLAVMSVHSIGLVHGDIKPDNIMLGADETLYLIDYGSVSRPGDRCPMSCVRFSPPDNIMTYSWDVFATGRVLQELEREGLNLCACGKRLCIDMCTDLAKERPCLQQCLSRLLGCKCGLWCLVEPKKSAWLKQCQNPFFSRVHASTSLVVGWHWGLVPRETRGLLQPL